MQQTKKPPPLPTPTISDAKRLANQYRRMGVLILSFGGMHYSRSGYGMKREHCRAIEAVSDQIAALIEDGTIEVPDCLRGGVEY